jgi:hypothetical protein
MKNTSDTISFRAPNDMLLQIDRQRAPFGLSRGAWVRGAIQQNLEQREQPREGELLEAAREDVATVAAEVAKIGSNVTRSLFILLTLLGNLPAEQAKEIVRSKLSA